MFSNFYFKNAAIGVASSAFMSVSVGCSVHPLPEDATGINTFEVIRKIRCEARTAIIESAVNLLRKSKEAAVRSLAERISQNHNLLNKDIYKKVDRETEIFLRKYDDTAIGFDFTFTMTENNDVSADIGFVSKVFNGSDSLGFRSSNGRERQNIRNVRITDTIESLIEQRTNCDRYATGVNLIYPITGNIGLFEVLDTFFNLNEVAPIAVNADDKTTLFADTLKFTTTFSGSVGPGLTITPLGKNYGLSAGAFSAESKRSDVHTLVIAISLPPERQVISNNGTVAPTRKAATKEIVNNLIDYQIAKNRVLPLGLAYPSTLTSP